MMRSSPRTFLAAVTLVCLTTFVVPAIAQGALPPPGPTSALFGGTSGPTKGYFIHPNCLGEQNDSTTPCGLREIMLTAINITKFILAIVGSVTLLVFMYGGFLWLTSAGNSEQIQRGKKVFVNAIVGLVIIFASTIIINMIVAALTGQDIGSAINLFPGTGSSQPILQVPTSTTNIN